MTINYKKTAWNDNASGYTPITPTRLNNIESALKSVCDGWDSVSQKTSSGWRYMLIGSVFIGWYAGNMTPGSANADSVGKYINLPVKLTNYVATPVIVEPRDQSTVEARLSGMIYVVEQVQTGFGVRLMRDNYAFLDGKTYYFGITAIGSTT